MHLNLVRITSSQAKVTNSKDYRRWDAIIAPD